MKSRILNLVLLSFTIGLSGLNFTSGQTPRTLSLREAIDLSIKNSKQLKQQQARILEATAAVREAEEGRLPDLKVTGAYMHLNNPNIDLKVKQGNGATTAGEGPARVSQAAYSIANLSLPIYAGGRIRYGMESARYLA